MNLKQLVFLHFKRYFSQPVFSTHQNLFIKNEPITGISKNEYCSRRQKFIARIVQHQKLKKTQTSCNNLILFMSSPKVFMAHDVPYPFRQNSDFSYLCGLLEIDSILAMETSTNENDLTSTLFVPSKDPHKEMWDGPIMLPSEVMELTGVDNVCEISLFKEFINSVFTKSKSVCLWYDYHNPTHLSYHNRFIEENIGNFSEVVAPRALLQSVRLHKSNDEIQLMKKACQISCEAFKEVIKFSTPDINEAHLYAKMDYESRIRGADRLAYPPVIAGGNRANIIHYIRNDKQIKDGELVLVDAGCELQGYCSDITRTWPINGKFSMCQLDLYEALLEVQVACIALCRPHSVSLNDIYMQMLNLLGQQLCRVFTHLNNTSPASFQALGRMFCPHHVGHYLGMDVHDVDHMPRNIPLKPGMVITIEPGIYINESIKIVSKEWQGMGLRIEDDILITEDEPIVLSADAPKLPSHITQLMKTS